VASSAKIVTTSISFLQRCFINYFHAFLIIRNLAKQSKINNMGFINLMIISYFLQIEGIKRGYLTKDDYFSKQEEIIIIYPL
jgi:hypothetical protein